MAMQLDFEAVDLDNHYYEPLDAFTRHLDPAFASRGVKVVQDGVSFAALNPACTTMVRYEDLSEHPQQTLQDLFIFLGVAATPAVVRHCCAQGAFERVSGGRLCGQEDRGSFFRRGLPGDWRNHFTEAHVRRFKESCGDLLVRLGYERDLNWSL